MSDAERLQEILATMDVPEQRLTDMGWLSRNLGFRNFHHPNFNESMELIIAEMKASLREKGQRR